MRTWLRKDLILRNGKDISILPLTMKLVILRTVNTNSWREATIICNESNGVPNRHRSYGQGHHVHTLGSWV